MLDKKFWSNRFLVINIASLGPNLESNFVWILQDLTCKLGPRSIMILRWEPPTHHRICLESCIETLWRNLRVWNLGCSLNSQILDKFRCFGQFGLVWFGFFRKGNIYPISMPQIKTLPTQPYLHKFDGRQPLMEDDLWWKTTFDERGP